MTQLNLVSNNKSIRNMSYDELRSDVSVLNLNSAVPGNKELHHKLVTELNYKSYEKKLDDKNKPKLGNISRPKYNKIVSFSNMVIDDIFTEISENIFNVKPEKKFKNLNQILK